jgi:integrase/recombinase XerD
MRINAAIAAYLNHLKLAGCSYYTVRAARYGLARFARFAEHEQVVQIEQLNQETVAEYQQELYFCLTAKGKPLTLRSQSQLLSNVKGFCRFLKEKDYLIHDPADSLKLPKKPRRLPRVILSEKEVQKLLLAPDMRTNRGYRNRIILELLYDTAIRRAEVAAIGLADLDLAGGFILIHGKGDKQRVVPVSARVCDLVQNYVLMIRPAFIGGQDPGYLIVNRWGARMNANGIWAVVKRCAQLAGIKKNVSTHTLRHTCATHMLKNGAPVRYLQEMLGHESLESTQIYTHVTINDLKQIHAKYHPCQQL